MTETRADSVCKQADIVFDAVMNETYEKLPTDYDKEKEYPAFFLTDGVWRFGNTPSLRKEMESGKADPTILVTLGYDYNNDGSEGNFRFT